MIIFGTRTKLLQNSSIAAVGTCNYCNSVGSLYAYKQVKYFHIFWIPIFPYSTEIISVCNHCKKVNYQREIDPQTLATIRSSGMPKTPVGYFSGLILMVFSSDLRPQREYPDPLKQKNTWKVRLLVMYMKSNGKKMGSPCTPYTVLPMSQRIPLLSTSTTTKQRERKVFGN